MSHLLSVFLLSFVLFVGLFIFPRDVRAANNCTFSFQNGVEVGTPVPITVDQSDYFGGSMRAELIIRNNASGEEVAKYLIAFGSGDSSLWDKYIPSSGTGDPQPIVFTPTSGGVYRMSVQPLNSTGLDDALCDTRNLGGNLEVLGPTPTEAAPTGAAPKPSPGPEWQIDLPKDNVEISGLTPYINLSFLNLVNGDEYFLCARSLLDCESDTYSTIPSPEDEMIVIETICGNGPDGVKGANINPGEKGKACNSSKDYFHEGKFYRVGLLADDGSDSYRSIAQFYVNYYYPTVVLNSQYKVDAQRAASKEPKELIIKDMETGVDVRNGKEREVELKSGLNGALDVLIESMVKAGGKNRNDFQIVLSRPFDEKDTVCVDLENTSDYATWSKTPNVYFGTNGNKKSTDGDNGSLGALPIGEYFLYINERVDRDAGFGVGSDCDGGFSYYKLKLESRADENNVLHLYLNVKDSQFDPNNTEAGKFSKALGLAPIQCAEGLTANGEVTRDTTQMVECTKLETAIGALSIDPMAFIGDIMSWVIGFAILGGLGLLIYSGYLLIYSRGDQEKITNAKDNIKAAIIGLVFLILSIAILEFIGVQILRIPGLGS